MSYWCFQKLYLLFLVWHLTTVLRTFRTLYDSVIVFQNFIYCIIVMMFKSFTKYMAWNTKVSKETNDVFKVLCRCTSTKHLWSKIWWFEMKLLTLFFVAIFRHTHTALDANIRYLLYTRTHISLGLLRTTPFSKIQFGFFLPFLKWPPFQRRARLGLVKGSLTLCHQIRNNIEPYYDLGYFFYNNQQQACWS